ncbi:hypothetical protein Ae201684_008147 [Aphanomyces euteiches]|uniref:Uncharacterized protein n=1 Tax=Aphanomyces euteiches TaxID=100861 RepID=A0A6G0X641_9STRA|nr:hypothetical protein Ae201684_008147 [Aphanomyces euteiches]
MKDVFQGIKRKIATETQTCSRSSLLRDPPYQKAQVPNPQPKYLHNTGCVRLEDFFGFSKAVVPWSCRYVVGELKLVLDVAVPVVYPCLRLVLETELQRYFEHHQEVHRRLFRRSLHKIFKPIQVQAISRTVVLARHGGLDIILRKDSIVDPIGPDLVDRVTIDFEWRGQLFLSEISSSDISVTRPTLDSRFIALRDWTLKVGAHSNHVHDIKQRYNFDLVDYVIMVPRPDMEV